MAVMALLIAAGCADGADAASAAWRVTGSKAAAARAGTVNPPANVTTSGTTCNGITQFVEVSWTPSDSPGVIGYQVDIRTSTGQTIAAQAASAATNVRRNVTKPNAATKVFVTATVTTLTTYGWTKQSQASAPTSC